MGETTVKIKCTDQKLEAIEAPIIASGGFNENKVHFEFCPLWDGFTKTATFYVKKNEVYTSAVDSNGTCIVPHEVTENPSNMFFGVFGVKDDGTTRTSEVIKYKIVQGAITEDAKPSDPTPDIYEQILAKMAALDTHGHTIADVNGLQVELDGKSENGTEETDSSVAYVKSVPANAANYAKVNKIGGLTRKCTNLFAYNTFVTNGYTTRFNVKPGEVLYCAETIDFPMQWGVYDVNGTLIGTFYDLGFTNSSPLTVPSNASYIEVKAYGGQQGTYTQEGVCVGIPIGDSEHILLLNDECYGVIHKGDIVKIGAGYYTVIEDAPAGDAEIEIRISPALADPDINGEAYLATINEVQTAMQKYASLYIGYEPYSGGLRSVPVTEVESVGVNLCDLDSATFWDCGREGGTIRSNINGAYYSALRFYTKSDWILSMRGKPITFSVKETKGKSISIVIYGTRADGSTYQEGTMSSRSLTMVVADDFLTVDALELRFNRLSSPHNDTTSVFEELMLYEGSTALPYRPYQRHTLPIPESVQALDGYGWGINDEVYNYIDFEKNQFVKRVGKKVLDGTEAYHDTGIYVYTPIFAECKPNGKMLCDRYGEAAETMIDKTCFIGGAGIAFRDDTYNSAPEFKTYATEQYASGTPITFYYELATPEITAISIGDTLPVEAGGTVTMVNEHGYDVPNSITFFTNANDSYLGAKGFVGNLLGTAARAECDSDGNNIPETYASKEELKEHTHSFNDLADKPEITTYTLSKDGNLIILKGSDGSASSVVDATETGSAGGTTFTLVKRGNKISLEGSDGSYSEVEDDNTTYTKDLLGLGNVDNTADKNKNVNHAVSSDTATCASAIGQDGNTSAPMRFNWSGQDGTPPWVWGGTDASNIYVYNPAKFSVNYATNAGSASTATKATQDGNGNNIADTYATKGEIIGGTVVDITSAVSVSGSNGDNPITKAVDTGSSVLILFEVYGGDQEFADLNFTFPSYLDSKLVVNAILYGTNGTENLTANDNTFGMELGSFWSGFCGYGSSLEIKYV